MSQGPVMVIVMILFSLLATSALVLLATSVLGPRINRPAGTRPGERGDACDDAPWSAPWEARSTPEGRDPSPQNRDAS